MAVMSAVLLSACENKGTRTVVYTDPVPYLTTVTWATTTPADTYSEYMATYTPTDNETGNHFIGGVAADTGITAGTFPGISVTAVPVGDTAVTVTETKISETTVPGSEGSSPTEGTEFTELTESESTSTSAAHSRPAADTAFSNKVQADTAPPRITETETSVAADTTIPNGGTDNAN